MSQTFIRDFYNDPEYRESIQNNVREKLKEISAGVQFTESFPNYEIKDLPERLALVAFDLIKPHHGDILEEAETYAEDYVDLVAETIRQGISQSIYERMPVIGPPLSLDKANMGPVDPSQPLGLLEGAYVSWSKQRWDNVGAAFMAAEVIALEPNLSDQERCHKVAHAVYRQAGMQKVLDRNAMDVQIDPGQDYATFYEYQHASKIQNQKIQAAKDLFGR